MSVEKDLSRMAVGESLEDDAFEKFKDRISHEPEQVVSCSCTWTCY